MTEDELQVWAVEFIKRAVPKAIVHHSPNEVPGEVGKPWTRKMIKKGMLPGFYDIIILHHGRSYFIELKRPGNALTAKQKDFRAQLDLHGFRHALCYSQKQVAEALSNWQLSTGRIMA